MAAKKKFIQSAIKRPGALTRKAKAAHMSNAKFEQKHKHDKGLAGKEARFAILLKRVRPH
jgi:hypothetical protein